MTPKPTSSSKKQNVYKPISYIGVVLYILALGIFSLLLLTEPEGLNVKLATAILVTILFISGLAPAHLIASKTEDKTVAIFGTIALAVLFALIGLFIAAGIGWLIALSHA